MSWILVVYGIWWFGGFGTQRVCSADVARCCELQAPPEPKYVPFKGLGHTLGTKPASSEEAASSMITSGAPRSSQALIIDDARPATSIQALNHPLVFSPCTSIILAQISDTLFAHGILESSA
jgi:hypothetical protein